MMQVNAFRLQQPTFNNQREGIILKLKNGNLEEVRHELADESLTNITYLDSDFQVGPAAEELGALSVFKDKKDYLFGINTTGENHAALLLDYGKHYRSMIEQIEAWARRSMTQPSVETIHLPLIKENGTITFEQENLIADDEHMAFIWDKVNENERRSMLNLPISFVARNAKQLVQKLADYLPR